MPGKSKSKYEYRKLLDKLEGIRGRGTELITVYVTPGYDLNQVIQQLREEEGTAQNIKSKNTRKNVVSALRRIINFLQKYAEKNGSKAPENGMAIYSGNITGEEGKTDIKLYWVEPPEPIQSRIYRCDKEFLLDPLRKSIQDEEKVGLIVLDAKEATIATLKGKRVNVVRNMTSGVWGKHSKGGQSAQRFERLREKALKQFLKRVAEDANREFAEDEKLKAVLVGGPGPTKERFLKEDLLKNDVQEKVTSVYDTGYADEQGIKELVNKAEEVLKDLDVMKEKNLIQRFLRGVASGDEMATYGVGEVRRHLKGGAVDTLLVSEDQNFTRFKVQCQTCGHEFEEVVTEEGDYRKKVSGMPCPECGREDLNVVETEDEVKNLCELADQTGAEVEFISTETEEGKQFHNAFKGVGALLRYEL